MLDIRSDRFLHRFSVSKSSSEQNELGGKPLLESFSSSVRRCDIRVAVEEEESAFLAASRSNPLTSFESASTILQIYNDGSQA